MCYGWRNGATVAFFVLSWLVAAAVPVAAMSTGDSSTLLAGLLIAIVAIAALVVTTGADDPLFCFGRSVRGPTSEEQRRRGELRRHSHPDTAGRPRPRAPGSR